MHQFKKLEIWKRSQDFCVNIYALTGDFPKSEMFGLQSQIRRSAVSIPSNIAEGTSRNSNKEFNRFLEIALGSAYELETQLIIANRLNYIEKCTFDEASEELNSVIQMTMKFRSRIRNQLN
ncbi:MAG: four helix bundle protein [Crocinitomicaceae bacterium]|nr:four helix bundle protein [Flavobacteriales bacterium]NQZ34366.1 four helix bundle protein [Crocinitomicaceae bacterium]